MQCLRIRDGFGIYGVAFLFVAAFLFLVALQTASFADSEIKALEQKLELLKQKAARTDEYKKMRGMLEAKLKGIQDQIQMLDEEYKDVAKPAATPVPEAKQAVANPGAKGPDHEWTIQFLEAGSNSCKARAGLKFDAVKVDDAGEMLLKASSRGSWRGTYSGNLRAKKIKLKGDRGAQFSRDTTVTSDAESYTIRGKQVWDTGSCTIVLRLE